MNHTSYPAPGQIILYPGGISETEILLAHLAGEMHATIGQQGFGLADAAGIEDDLAGCGLAGVVLDRDAEVEVAKRHPDPLAAPADMDRLALERHGLAKCRDRLRRERFLKTGLEREVAGADN